jgi:hypothetical protein
LIHSPTLTVKDSQTLNPVFVGADMFPTNLSFRPGQICGIVIAVLFFCLPAYSQPSNDECATATVVPSIPFTDSVDTTTADADPPSLSCNGNGNQTDGNAVWYTWTPSADVTVNISTAGSTLPGGGQLDTAHGVYTGNCGALTEVACVDLGLNDDLIFEAEAGVTYFIKFGEFLNGVGGGNLVVTIDVPPPPEQIILESVRDGISPPIRDVVTAAPLNRSLSPQDVNTEEIPMFMRDEDEQSSVWSDKGLQDLIAKRNLFEKSGNVQSTNGNNDAKLKQIFEGASNDDNANILGILLAPPDTDGDVGPKHYVQMTNLLTTVFNQKGDVLLGPFANNVFFTGLGGLCETTNRGDPIVLYDEQTNRWLVSQFAFTSSGVPPWSLCIAISTSGDPMGSYYQHEFDFSAIGFPDYPKYGFATDAIGMMVNLFSPFQGPGLGAIDKAEAFSDQQTTLVFYKMGANEFGFVVGDNDGPKYGNLPPTFATNNGGSGDRIDIWQINPDFANPVNSTIAEVAKIDVTPFDTDLCARVREQCIDQPGSGTGTPPNNITFLEAITDRLMHRLQIRNYGEDDQRAVVNHTIDVSGTGQAGVRWYEFRNDGSGWTLYQEGTFAPDTHHRWMGSIAMNKKGEIGLGYSISSSTRYPSIGVAGQTKQASGSGLLDVTELIAFDGNIPQNVQRQTARWGDYSAMAVDPNSDNRFWYTQEYARPNAFIGERFGWATKIIEFKLK